MDVFCQRHENPRPMRLVMTRKLTLNNKVLIYGVYQCSKNPIDHVREFEMSELVELDKLQFKESENPLLLQRQE